MESIEGPADELRELERSEAAPYINQPSAPFWLAPVFGSWFAAYVAAFALWNVSIGLFILSMVALSAVIGLFVGSLVRQYDTLPMPGRGNPPPEIRREYRVYGSGAALIGGLVVVGWRFAGLGLAVALAFVLVSVGYHVYVRRYENAAEAVRERLQ
ncbi:hypothetical protein [Flaviflexus huanghaiensis]|uniref:hypothetical protein n=1 Tax=Flaviflexus huanghaiensis TaxID=1111473 RepID=UPI0015FB60B7|nr:hypothetical protein [Flaviflexus huanghaiensis]